MRERINAQSQFDFEPSTLKLTNRYYAKYQSISSILDDIPAIVDAVHQDLQRPLKYATVKGKDGGTYTFTSDQVLRILLCQIIEGASLREIVIRIDDSNFLRRFVRIYNGPMMDFTTLDKLKNSILPATWKKVNELLGRHAVQKDLISGEKVRLDTTAVETNIHYPTDSTLLWDTYRVLARLIERARELDPQAVGDQRLHPRRAKRLAQQIGRKSGKQNASAELKPLYNELIGRLEALFEWARWVMEELLSRRKKHRYSLFEDVQAQALAEDLERYLQLGTRVVDQARRRVLQSDPVPNEEKLFSIFEPHSELLKRGKAGKPIEFGHMIQIQQVAQKFITDYEAFPKKPVEHQLLSPAMERHRRLFGEYPQEVAADKGYYESVGALESLRQKVNLVSIAKQGSRTEEETEQEHDPAFRHAQRICAGVEGTISFLKRVLGLFRCFNKGWEHFAATIGATVFSHNLLILARA
jgi:IS5 family transposase